MGVEDGIKTMLHMSQSWSQHVDIDTVDQAKGLTELLANRRQDRALSSCEVATKPSPEEWVRLDPQALAVGVRNVLERSPCWPNPAGAQAAWIEATHP